MADAEPEGPTVAASANQCLESFQGCLLRASLVHPRELSRVEDQAARFSTWATDIGVFAPARASMEHRLRYAPEVQSVVTGLLESLNYRIRTCSDALDQELGKSPTTKAQSLTNDQLERSFGDIATEISRLNKISNTIRSASKEAQILKASDFQIKDDDSNDVEPLLLGHFERHIGDRFPNTSTTIQQRLARAMLLRRKRILYRRHRQGNTSIRPRETALKAPVTMPTIAAPAPPSAPGKSKQDNGQIATVAETTTAPSQIQSATTLVPEKFKIASLSPSVISSSKTVALGNHEALVFPPAPGVSAKRNYDMLKKRRLAHYHAAIGLGEQGSEAQARLDESLKSDLQAIGEITCPYCLYALPAQEMFDERKWQNHVTNDLDPYVCLFEDCDEPDLLYHHSDEWLSHLHRHGRLWRCSSHRDLGPFSTREQYIGHTRGDHNSKLSDTQLRALANRNTRKRAKLFLSCPLCDKDEAESDGRLEDHIAGHLRSLALKSLPSYQEMPDDAGSGRDSVDASRPQSRSTVKDLGADDDMLEFRTERFWDDWRPQLTEPNPTNFLGDAHIELDSSNEDAWVASRNTDKLASGKSFGSLEDDPIIQSMLQRKRDGSKAPEFGVYDGSAQDATLTATPSTLQGGLAEHQLVFPSFLRAFYPFSSSHGMSDSSVILPLNEGDVILVHSIHTNGWADGTLLVSGARGWLPTNYCEPYDPEKISDLLKALIYFWIVLRGAIIEGMGAFRNQEYLKGIIAGVRYLLERTDCMNRESPNIQRNDALRRARKSLLSELSHLVKTFRSLQEGEGLAEETVKDLADEMILSAFMVVTKGVRFLDAYEEDDRMRAPVETRMVAITEEESAGSVARADSTRPEDQPETDIWHVETSDEAGLHPL